MDTDLKIRLEAMNSQLRQAKDKLKSFQTDLAGFPAHAFEWADSAMEAAAIEDVFLRVINALTAKDTKATRATMYEHAMQQVMQKSKHPSRSSGQCMNLMAQHTLSAWAQVAELMKPEKNETP